MTDTLATTRLGPTAADERRRWIALVVLCAGFLMIILDQTIVNVALPSIQTDLHFSQSNLAWVVNAYLIAFGGLLLLVGRLGDLIGRKRIFLVGLTVFTVASLVCGVSQSQELLVAARFVQGAGGAMTSAVILGMIVTMFPRPAEQAKAIGVYSFVAAAGGAIGLLAGGVLTQALNWHWIFFVNLPIGVATGYYAVRLIADERGIGLDHGADVPGAVLLVSSLMLGVYTIVEASGYGWGSLHTIGFGAVALGLLVAFVVRQRLAANPLVPLRIFRSRIVTGANLVQILMVAGIFGMFFLGALYLQRVLHYDAIQVGLAFLPVALGIAILSLGFSARLITRFGAQWTLVPGLTSMALGLILFRGVVRRCELLDRPAPGHGAARHRGRSGLPLADDARDVERHAGGLGPRLRPGQHHAAGRRSARARRSRDALEHPQQLAAGERPLTDQLADERVSPGVLNRRGAGCHRDRSCGRPAATFARRRTRCRGRRARRRRRSGIDPAARAPRAVSRPPTRWAAAVRGRSAGARRAVAIRCSPGHPR